MKLRRPTTILLRQKTIFKAATPSRTATAAYFSFREEEKNNRCPPVERTCLLIAFYSETASAHVDAVPLHHSLQTQSTIFCVFLPLCLWYEKQLKPFQSFTNPFIFLSPLAEPRRGIFVHSGSIFPFLFSHGGKRSGGTQAETKC